MSTATATSSLTNLVAIPAGINAGIVCPGANDLLALLGKPRETFSSSCQPVTNRALAAQIATADVGPFRATGFRPALESLRQVMADISREQPAVYRALGTAGMLCCRQQRGSTRISSHSWGTAIDLTLEGRLDTRGDRRVQQGLTLIAPIFNRHGWYWGAAFRTEDAMHFECGKALIQRWALNPNTSTPGTLPSTPAGHPGGFTPLRRGDNGPRVRLLQEKLNRNGAALRVDGDFGERTEIAVRSFQARHRLTPDGIVGRYTANALGL